MSKIDFKSRVMKQQNIAAGTLADFAAEGVKQGFNLMVDAATNDVVHVSKAGNPQLIFQDTNNDLVFVRISAELDAALLAGEKVTLQDSPVYDIDLEKDGKIIGNMYVVGMKGTVRNLKIADPKTAFKATYKKPEPA